MWGPKYICGVDDIELEYEEGKNQNKLRQEDINKISATFEKYEELKRYSRIVDLDEIKENDYNLNIRRYADTSPPPEIFDVRAILHGGIPVREVEDEYIQEEQINSDEAEVLKLLGITPVEDKSGIQNTDYRNNFSC